MKSDKRIGQIIEQVLKFNSADFSSRLPVSDKGDELDAVIAGLNTLGEELEAKALHKDETERMNALLDLLLKYNVFDFEQKAVISNRGDEIDALAAGMNTLVEELELSMVSQKKHVNELLLTTNFLTSVLDNIPNMIFVKDAKELRFVRFNKAGETLLGFSKEDLLGKNDHDFFPPEQADAFIEKDREVLRNRVLFSIPEEPIQTANGQRWLHTKKIPILDENDQPVYLLGISEDITDRKSSEDALKKSNEQLESVNKELEAFSYSISHDLRAPLRAVNGYAQMLNEDYGPILDGEGKRLLERIQYNATKMGNLIDDLLAFSRLGRKNLQKSGIDMKELTEGVLFELGKSMRHNAVIITGNLPPVQGDYALIHQVMFNLISNAVKYSSKKEKPMVEIQSEVKTDEIVFSVKDNGAGFDMQYIDKLFGVFQRLHSMEDFEGTGVGLAIVQRIVNKHGGRVWGEGKLDAGATFFFSLPKE